jgi:hypothetical protein
MQKSLRYILSGGLLAATFLPLASGAAEKIGAPPAIINDESIASALGANGKFFIVTADEARMLTAPNARSKTRMTFLKNSCLMSLGSGKDQNGYAQVLAMGGEKKNATGFVERKHLDQDKSGISSANCLAFRKN